MPDSLAILRSTLDRGRPGVCDNLYWASLARIPPGRGVVLSAYLEQR